MSCAARSREHWGTDGVGVHLKVLNVEGIYVGKLYRLMGREHPIEGLKIQCNGRFAGRKKYSLYLRNTSFYHRAT